MLQFNSYTVLYCVFRKLPASTSGNGERVNRHETSNDDQPLCSNHMEVTPGVCNKTSTMNGVASQLLLVGKSCSQQVAEKSSTCHLDSCSDNAAVIQCANNTGRVGDRDMMPHPGSPLQQAHSSKVLSTDYKTSEQDVLSTAMFTSPPTCVSDHKVGMIHWTKMDVPFEDESPTPPVNNPVCSTPDQSHTTLRMSRSPSIPLQNITLDCCNKVDVTPVVLPKRMIALEGLYQADSPDVDHIHDSLDMFDDTALSVPDNQPVNDHLDMFDNTAALVANPVNSNQDGVADNIKLCSQKPVKDDQNVLDDLFDNTASLVPPSNQPVQDNQDDIDMVVDTAPYNKPVKNSQDGNDASVGTASLHTDNQPIKDSQDSQISAPHDKFVDGQDNKFPATLTNEAIKTDQNVIFDKASAVEPSHKPVKDDQSVDVISPVLFTPDQASLPHGHNDSPMDTSPSSAIGDSISTQVSFTILHVTVKPATRYIK